MSTKTIKINVQDFSSGQIKDDIEEIFQILQNHYEALVKIKEVLKEANIINTSSEGQEQG